MTALATLIYRDHGAREVMPRAAANRIIARAVRALGRQPETFWICPASEEDREIFNNRRLFEARQ